MWLYNHACLACLTCLVRLARLARLARHARLACPQFLTRHVLSRLPQVDLRLFNKQLPKKLRQASYDDSILLSPRLKLIAELVQEVPNIRPYYMASSVSGQDESNPAL